MENSMTNKIVLGFLITSFFLAAPAYAKPKSKLQPQQQVTVDTIVAKMKLQLELTDSQTDAVKPIVENYLLQEQQLRLDEKKQLSKVLTEQQLYTWNFLLNENKEPKAKKTRSLF
jgi:hypothetical protein